MTSQVTQGAIKRVKALAESRGLSPVESKNKDTRYLEIHEDDKLDEAQMATRIRQAAALPGWVLWRRQGSSQAVGQRTEPGPV